MALNKYQQLIEQLNKSSYILIASATNDNGDGLAAALALKLFLEQMHKPADVIGTARAASKLAFLAGAQKISNRLNSLQKLVIELDISKNKIGEFNYDIKNDALKIFVTPKQGKFNKEDIRIGSSKFKYDLIITSGAEDLESLGSVYDEHTDFFYTTPLINIDNQATNEHYGQINIIDINACSRAEIIFEILKDIKPEFISADIATALLAGIIINTNNYRAPDLSPRCLNNSSALIRLGAERENIARALNQNKNIATLNLWGRVLARLKTDSHYKLAWSLLSKTDFEKSGASRQVLAGVVNELIADSPAIEITLILFETEAGNIAGEILTTKNYNALELGRPLGAVGDERRAEFALATNNLIEAEETAVNKLRERIKPRQ